MTLENYHQAKDTAERYGLEKVEEYKRFNDRYQNWKGETKKDLQAWKEKQVKKITGKS
jgi:hypothetical protein